MGKNAKQWVTRQYPNEVAAYRRKATHQQVALLVGTEADEQTVGQRLEALAASLATARAPAGARNEAIVLWIPKWHVETWLLFLLGNTVNENEKYRYDAGRSDFAAVGEQFVRRFRESSTRPPATSLPSLEAAFQETTRLPK